MQLTTSKVTNTVSVASSRGQRVNVAKGTSAVTCPANFHSRGPLSTWRMLLSFCFGSDLKFFKIASDTKCMDARGSLSRSGRRHILESIVPFALSVRGVAADKYHE